jgi:hypothetical protein
MRFKALSVMNERRRALESIRIRFIPKLQASPQCQRVLCDSCTSTVVFSPSIKNNRGFTAVKAPLVEATKLHPSTPAPFSGARKRELLSSTRVLNFIMNAFIYALSKYCAQTRSCGL